MILYYAGAKPPTRAHPWDCPRIAAEADLHIMLTFFEFQGKSGKRKRKFLRDLKRMRKGKKRSYGKEVKKFIKDKKKGRI